MTLINRYILVIFARFCSLSLAAFAVIYLLIDFFEKVDDFVGHSAGLDLYFLYFLNKLPLIISQLMPLAILMGTFMTLATLSRHGELTAMFSSGISLFKVTRPLLILSFVIALGTLAFNEFFLPMNIQKMNQVFNQQIKGKSDVSLKQGEIWFRENRSIVHLRFAEPREQVLRGISVYKMNENFQVQTTTEADRATFSNGQWVADNAEIRRFEPATGDIATMEKQQEYPLSFHKGPEEFLDVYAKREEMNFQKLWTLSRKLTKEGYDATGYQVDMHTRLSSPFACLIMAFLGIPFALGGSRHAGLSMGVTISVAVGIGYYFINAILTAFGYSTVFPPVVAAWAANILFLLLGLYLLLAIQK